MSWPHHMWSSDEDVSTDGENDRPSPEAASATEIWDQAYSRIGEIDLAPIFCYESILCIEMGEPNQWRISPISTNKATSNPPGTSFSKPDSHVRRQKFELCLEHLIENLGGLVELAKGDLSSIASSGSATGVAGGGCPAPSSYSGSFQDIVGGLREEAKRQPHAIHAWTAATCAVLMIVKGLILGKEIECEGLDYVLSRLPWVSSFGLGLVCPQPKPASPVIAVDDFWKKGISTLYESTLRLLIDLVNANSDHPLANPDFQDFDESTFKKNLASFTHAEKALAGTSRIQGLDIFNSLPQKGRGKEELAAWSLGPMPISNNLPAYPTKSIDHVIRWLLRHHYYTNLYRHDERGHRSRILWVTGDMGSGKSLMLTAIARHLSDRLGETECPAALLHVSCSRQGSASFDASTILRGLICALLSNQPLLRVHVHNAYASTGRTEFVRASDFVALSGLLFDMVNDYRFDGAIFLIDDIDECETESWFPMVIRLLCMIASSTKETKNLSWVISSRGFYMTAFIDKSEATFIDLNSPSPGWNTITSLFMYNEVLSILSRIGCRPRLQIRLANKICRKPNGGLVWFRAACQALQQTPGERAGDVVRDMPKTLEGLFAHMVTELDDPCNRHVRSFADLLAVVSTAFKPMRISELRRLARLPAWIDVGLLAERCYAYLIPVGDRIYHINPSVKISMERLLDPQQRQYGHLRICQRALENLTAYFVDDEQRAGGTDGMSVTNTEEKGPEIIEYASLWWMKHLCKVEDGDPDGSKTHLYQQASDFLRRYAPQWVAWLSLRKELDAVMVRMAEMVHVLKDRAIHGHYELIEVVRQCHHFMTMHYSEMASDSPSVTAALLLCPNWSPTTEAWKRQCHPRINTFPAVDSKTNPPLGGKNGHTRPVRDIEYSYDGQTIVTASQDHTVRLWNAETKTTQRVLKKHTHPVECVDVSRKDLIASLSRDGEVNIWNMTTGQCLRTLKVDVALPEKPILAFANHGTVLWLISKAGSVLRWDTERFDLTVVDMVTNEPGAMWFSPRMALLATSHPGKTAVYDLNTGHICGLVNEEFTCVGFIYDRGHIVTLSSGERIRVWNTKTGTCTSELPRVGPVSMLSVSPDGKYVAPWGGKEGKISIIDVVTRAIVQTETTLHTLCLSFCSQSKSFATGSSDGTVKHWSLAPAQDENVAGEVSNAKETGRAISGLAVSSDTHIFAAARGNTVDIYDTSGEDFELMQSIQSQGDISHVTISRDGRLLAISTLRSGVEIHNIEDSSLVQRFDGHRRVIGRITRAAFSPDGQRVASASDDCTFKVWPAAQSPADDNVLVRSHAGPVRCVAFSADGSLLASGGDDCAVEIWCLRTRWRLAVCGHLSASVSDVAFFPAQPGHVLVVCSDKSVARWDGRENKIVWRLSNCDYAWRGLRFDAVPASAAGDDSRYVMTDLGSRYVGELASTLTHRRTPDRAPYGMA